MLMHVFLVPVGADRHIPYCEPREAVASGAEGRGLIAGLVARFRTVMAAAEQYRHLPDAPHGTGRFERIRRWALHWVADRVAEQRLLWQLRHCEHATLFHPPYLTGDEAMRLLRTRLEHESDRHLIWLLVNTLLLIASGVLAVIPGPNLIAYYLAFRVVGHYLARRGARQGLGRVEWTPRVSAALGDLRTALHLDPTARHTRVRDIASELELPHLATFVERIALKGA
jgi:hypothetical protein